MVRVIRNFGLTSELRYGVHPCFKQRYKIINWRVASVASAGGDHGAHALGARVDSGKVLFFEPNSGEWQTTRGAQEFVPFFQTLCGAYGFKTIDIVPIIEF